MNKKHLLIITLFLLPLLSFAEDEYCFELEKAKFIDKEWGSHKNGYYLQVFPDGTERYAPVRGHLSSDAGEFRTIIPNYCGAEGFHSPRFLILNDKQIYFGEADNVVLYKSFSNKERTYLVIGEIANGKNWITSLSILTIIKGQVSTKATVENFDIQHHPKHDEKISISRNTNNWLIEIVDLRGKKQFNFNNAKITANKSLQRNANASVD